MNLKTSQVRFYYISGIWKCFLYKCVIYRQLNRTLIMQVNFGNTIWRWKNNRCIMQLHRPIHIDGDLAASVKQSKTPQFVRNSWNKPSLLTQTAEVFHYLWGGLLRLMLSLKANLKEAVVQGLSKRSLLTVCLFKRPLFKNVFPFVLGGCEHCFRYLLGCSQFKDMVRFISSSDRYRMQVSARRTLISRGQ